MPFKVLLTLFLTGVTFALFGKVAGDSGYHFTSLLLLLLGKGLLELGALAVGLQIIKILEKTFGDEKSP